MIVGVFLLQNNAFTHTAQVAEDEAADSANLLLHPSYSSDLAPSDFLLFPKLKSHLLHCHFRNNDGIIYAEEEF